MASKVSFSDKEGPHTLVFSTRAYADAYAKTVKNALVEDCDEQTSTRFTRLGSALEEENKRWIEKRGVKMPATETHEAYVHMPIGSSTLGFDDDKDVANKCIFCGRKCGQAVACYNCRRFNSGP
jgi:hypothetical protein